VSRTKRLKKNWCWDGMLNIGDILQTIQFQRTEVDIMKANPLWRCKKYIKFEEALIPISIPNDANRIRTTTQFQKILYRILIKPYRLTNRLFVDGYIAQNVGKWIKRYSLESDIILDVGCGDMRLYKHIPRDRFYYAFDISMNELFLREGLSKNSGNLYFAFASATTIPLDSNVANIVICTEVLEHIPEYQKVIKELYRVIAPRGMLLISIPNNFCQKYQIKGQHADHCNRWSYEEFVNLIKQSKFDLIEGFMIGKWLRLPLLWRGKTSYTLPLSSEREFYNSSFLYAFRARKDG